VLLDGKQIDSSVTASADYWIIAFSYSHSTHQVTINLASASREGGPLTFNTTTILLGVFAFALVTILLTFLVLRRKRKD
jgi:hypothetical protein